MYTLEDLGNAKSELELWDTKLEHYSGNNPNKYQADIKSARSKIRIITESLKDSGELQLSDKEKMEQALDKEFPNAKSKQVVEFQGEKYQRKFYPLEKSRSGKTVTEWGKEWTKLSE